MAQQDAIRQQIEQCAREFYGQALNLTLSNPLLKLPSGPRGSKFLQLPQHLIASVADLLADGARTLTFMGSDAPQGLLDLAETSQRVSARGPLRVVLANKHEVVESTLRLLAKKNDELVEKRGLPCAYMAFGTLK